MSILFPSIPLAASNAPVGKVSDNHWQRFQTQLAETGVTRVIVGFNTSISEQGNGTSGALSVAADASNRAEVARVQDLILARLPAQAVKNIRRFNNFPAMAMEVDLAGLDKLLESSEVSSVQEDRLNHATLASSIPVIGANNAWSAGYSGLGQMVAILDTGVDTNHEHFFGKTILEACFSTTASNYGSYSSTSLCPDGSSSQVGAGAAHPCASGCSHGTHVASTAVGNGGPGSGVAKDAGLIAIQVFSWFPSYNSVMAWDSDYMAGLDYVYSLRNTYQIASANMSLGGGSYTDSAQCDTDYRDAKALIDQLRSAGIATVIAAGNEGLNNAISGPGCITTAVSVGATTDTDEIASFSNRASWLDIYAPGVSINAAVPWTNAYATMQGTSMATPHVAGAFAVLQGKARQSGSAAAVDDLVALMRSTGKTVTDSVTGLALPRLRLDAAVSGSTPGSQYGATYQSAASLNLNAGTTTTVPVTVTNTGSLTWGANSVFQMSYHWYQGSTLVTWEGNRTLLPTAVGPGQSLTLNAQVKAPSTAGTYTLKWDLIQEGVTWFSSKGVTMGQASATVVSAAPSYGATYQSAASLNLNAGTTTTVPVTVTNTGSLTWGANSVFRMSYHWYQGSTLVTWEGNRTLLPTAVGPGQSLTLNAQVKAPSTAGTYTLKWDLVQEGVTWFSSKGVTMGQAAATVVSAAPSYGATYQSAASLNLNAGTTTTVPVTVTNTGSLTWGANSVFRMSYHWYQGSTLVTWEGNRTLLPTAVGPGQSLTLNAQVKAPSTAGTYTLKWDLVQEGVTWFSSKGVTMGQAAATVVSAAPSYGATYQSAASLNLNAGTTTTVPVTVTNTGSLTWGANSVFRMSYHWYQGSTLVTWEGNRTLLPTAVGPGQSLTLNAQVKAPSTAGTYTLKWDLVQEGVTWFSSKGVTMGQAAATVVSAAPSYGATYQSAASLNLNAGTTTTVPVTVTNTGSLTWGANSVFRMSYHWYQGSTLVTWEGNRTLLPTAVGPGQSLTLNAQVKAPSTAGTYTLKWDLVQEGVTWFSSKGVTMGQVAVVVP